MKYLKITFLKMVPGKKEYEQGCMILLNESNIISMQYEDGYLSVTANDGGIKCAKKAANSKFLFQTNSRHIFRFLKQAGFVVTRRYFWQFC